MAISQGQGLQMTPAKLALERWTLLEAELATGASALFAPKAFQSPGGRALASFDPFDSSPAPAPLALAKLICGPRSALLGLSSWRLAASHPAASGLDPERLPAPLRLALLDALLQPLLEDLSRLLGAEASLAETGEEAWPSSGRALKFRILLEGPSGKVAETVAIAIPSEADARWVLSRLSALPRPRRSDMGFVEVPVAIVAGALSLGAAETASLAPGDLLIADDPPIREGLAFLERPWRPWLALALGPGQAAVASLKPEGVSPKEAFVDDSLAPPAGGGQAKGGDAHGKGLSSPPDLELPLRFEIGRRMMSLRDLEALAPGAVLPLDNDPGKPLTVTCHGKPLARGVLVDLGDGRMGVLLTDVGAEAPSPGAAPAGPPARPPARP